MFDNNANNNKKGNKGMTNYIDEFIINSSIPILLIIGISTLVIIILTIIFTNKELKGVKK